jgi:pimeloyl-ACP methyl ester carboxylesterase
MSTFLLVHGSWHGAWCWERVVPILESRNHRVVSIDLPGHGDDRTSIFRITLGQYAAAICRAASAQGERVVAVGHSMGGFAISRAAVSEPELFSTLVYLAAFVPAPGEGLIQLALRDRDSLLRRSTAFRPTHLNLRPAFAKQAFYADCSDADVAWARSRLRPDPLFPLLQRYPAHPKLEIPRAFIECAFDRAISLSRQRAMYRRFPFDRVISMDTGHSPFLSAPGQLADHLASLSELAT